MMFGRLTYVAPLAALMTTAYAGCSSSAPSEEVDSDSLEAQHTKGAGSTKNGGGTPGAKVKCGGIVGRSDIKSLPASLKTRLCELAERPHAYTPQTAFAEADSPSLLFQHYLIDTNGFQPNVFTASIPGINDGTQPTATGPNGNKPAIGAVRVVLEPKPGKPTDPNDVHAAIDVFTDVSGLFVINNESGWYEGWMITDLKVPSIDPACTTAAMTPRFGQINQADADALAAMGAGNNVPGSFFTADGKAPKFPSNSDVFPAQNTNLVSFPVSLGSFNALQQGEIHAYWEFNPGTNWSFPTFELPASGGIPGTYDAGLYASISSVIPGSGPLGVKNSPILFGDNPNNPRDPDRSEISVLGGKPAHLEKRNRFLPSALVKEIHLDVFMRVASFEPGVGMPQRLFDAYAKEVAKVDKNGDGVISFEEAAIDGTSAGGQPNTRLYVPATEFNRYAMTRELNDGLLAPRFAPSQRAYVMAGNLSVVTPAVAASAPRDADDR